MLTFDQARERAETLRADFTGPGLFYVAPWGFEDASDYLMLVGAHEAVVGNDPAYMPIGDVQIVVDKRTGILRRINALDYLDHAWKPVGDWSAAPTD